MRVVTTILLAVACGGLVACGGPAARPKPAPPPPPRLLTARVHPLAAECAASADATAIACGGWEAAKLLCFSPEGRTCRALAVRYRDGELTWLYRPPEFDPSHPERFQPPEEKDTLRAFAPSISWDGRLIWFGARTVKDRGVVHEFDVQTGELRSVEKSSEWKVWAAEPQLRALPIVIGAPPLPEPSPAPEAPPAPPPER